jgi:hypothetical protein
MPSHRARLLHFAADIPLEREKVFQFGFDERAKHKDENQPKPTGVCRGFDSAVKRTTQLSFNLLRLRFSTFSIENNFYRNGAGKTSTALGLGQDTITGIRKRIAFTWIPNCCVWRNGQTRPRNRHSGEVRPFT